MNTIDLLGGTRRLFVRMGILAFILILPLSQILEPVLAFSGEFSSLAAPTADIYVDATFNSSTPGWGVTHFATIQAGVTASPVGGTVQVAAGDYIETVVITKTLSLIGPQFGIDPRPTGINNRPGGEAVLRPPTFEPDNMNLVTVTANNVIIDGFMLNGNNPGLGNLGELINGVRLHIGGGIANGVPGFGFAVVSGLTIRNNVLKNLNRYAVLISAPQNNPRGSHLIHRNVFDNITDGVTPQGSRRAIQLERSQYASITENNTTRVRIGVSITLFDRPNPGTPMVVSGNDFQTFREGVWINFNSQTSSPILIDSNTFRTDTGSTINVGIRVNKVIDSAQVSITNNTVAAGAAEGVYLWYVSGQTPVYIQNLNVISPIETGVGVYNLRNGNEPSLGTSRVMLDHVNVTGGFVGIQAMDDVPQTITSTLLMTVTNDSSVTGSTLGARVSGLDATLHLVNNDDGTGFGGNSVGVDVRDGGRLRAVGNTFANNSVGVRARNAGVLESVTQNFISGSTNAGVLITGTMTTVGPGVIWNNNLSGNPGKGATNNSAQVVVMHRNYWGGDDPATVAGEVSGAVDYSPWINGGTDSAPGVPGFQSDFMWLGVDDIASETSLSTLQEGIDFTAVGGSVSAHPGIYPGGMQLNRDIDFLFNGTTTVAGNITQFLGVLSAPPTELTLQGNFLLPGGVFDANNGMVNMQGAMLQTLGGQDTTFRTLRIQNTAGVELKGPVSVGGNLTLSSGTLDVSTYNLTLSPTSIINGAAPGTGTMVATQDGGALCKQFTAPGGFTFPVGDLTETANYTPAVLALSGGTYNNGAVCVGVVDDRYPSNYGINHLSRYWMVDAPGVSGTNADWEFRYASDAEDIVGSEAEMEGLGFDGATPVLSGGTINSSGNRVEFSTSNFDGIGFTAGNLPPVVMFSIGVTRLNATSSLFEWSVGDETDLEGYYVWRGTSSDVSQASMLGQVTPLGSNNSYQFPDNTLVPGVSYFYWLEARSNGPNDAFFGPFMLTWHRLLLPIIQK